MSTFSAEDPFIGGDNLTERGDHSDPWPPTVQLHLTFENTQWGKVNAQWRKVKIHSGEKSKCTVEKSKLGQLGKKKAGAVIRFEKTNAFFPPAAAAACYFSRQVKS